MCNPACIRLVGLVAHRRQGRPRMPGLQADRRKTALLELNLQPRRQGSGLVTDPPQPAWFFSALKIASGSVATAVSSTTFPSWSITQSELSSIATSSPAKYSMAVLRWRGGKPKLNIAATID
jgi:hypothetical protein